MDMNRRSLLSVIPTTLCGMTGCVDSSEEKHQEVSLVKMSNQVDRELEGEFRFIDEGNIVIKKSFSLRDDQSSQFEVEFPKDIAQVNFVVEIFSPEERTSKESVPSGVPNYYANIKSDSVDIGWAEN